MQPVERDAPAGSEGQHPSVEQMPRRHPLDQRVDCGQHDQRLLFGAAREPRQRIDAAAGDLAIRRHPVIGQTIPGRKGQHIESGIKESERRGEPRHAAIVAADMQPRLTAAFAGEAADRRRVMPLGSAEQRHGTGLLGERAGEFGHCGHVARGR